MYVTSPDGWRDVEMTGYLELKSYTLDEEFAWAARSGRQTTSNPCDGTPTTAPCPLQGMHFFKKLFTPVDDSGYTGKRHSSVSVEPLKDIWVGIKMVAYNIDQSVKLELWVYSKADDN